MASRPFLTIAYSARPLAVVLFVGSVVALGFGMFVQYGLGHLPCSLCVLQRLAFMALLLLALALSLLPVGPGVTRLLALLTVAAALAGLGVALYQVWIGFFPAEVPRCGRGPVAYFEETPLEPLANLVLEAAGDCGKPTRFFDLVTMPQLGLLGFIAAVAISLRIAVLAFRRSGSSE